MATYETDLKKVFARREMGGNEIKNLEWDAVYGNEGVPPLVDNPQFGQAILLKLRDLFKSETQRRSGWCSRRDQYAHVTYDGENALQFSSLLKVKMSCESDRSCPG